MAGMKWTKPSQATLDYFERLAPGAPLQTRKMFGLPCRFLNGYVLVGVFGNALMLHLSEADRFECIAAGAEPFRPMGRDMKGYVAIKPGTFEDHDLKWWIVRGMRYLASLEPRLEKPRAARKSKPATKKPRKGARPKTKTKAKVRTVKKVAPQRVTQKAARRAKPAPKKAAQKPAQKRPPAKKRRGRR